jgi:hypothetical protein
MNYKASMLQLCRLLAGVGVSAIEYVDAELFELCVVLFQQLPKYNSQMLGG